MQVGLTVEGRPELQGLAPKLKEQLETKRDFVATDNTLSMTPGETGQTLTLEGIGDFGVNNIAHSQIAAKLGIPKQYYDRMRTDAPSPLLSRRDASFVRMEPRRRVGVDRYGDSRSTRTATGWADHRLARVQRPR